MAEQTQDERYQLRENPSQKYFKVADRNYGGGLFGSTAMVYKTLGECKS